MAAGDIADLDHRAGESGRHAATDHCQVLYGLQQRSRAGGHARLDVLRLLVENRTERRPTRWPRRPRTRQA